MSILWIVPLTLALVHNGRAVAEDAPKKDDVPQECTVETCSPNLRPIPMIHQEKLHNEAMRRVERLYEHRFPHGKDIAKTNFHCNDKPYIPGFYADMEADCKIFHICLEKVVEHYKCPVNTSFEQKSLVCKPESKVLCHLTPTYYVVNANLHTGHPMFPGVKEFAFNRDSDKWLYDVVQGDKQLNASDKDSLERSVIRMLILMQFVDVSDILAGILDEEESHRGERAVNTSQVTGRVLDNILDEIFQLLPVRFSSESRIPGERKERTARNESLWGDFQENDPEPEGYNMSSLGTFSNESLSESGREGRTRKSRDFSDHSHSSRKARQIIEVILQSIGQTSGKLSVVSRSLVTWNYIKYLNLLSAGLKP